MSDRALTRRRLLKFASFACLARIRPLESTLTTSEDPVGWATLRSHMVRYFTDRQSAGKIGAAYLTTAPGEADPWTLVTAISATVSGGWRGLALVDRAKFRRLVAAEQRGDFERGRTVVIDGWVLSLTEARLAAISAILS
jgi:hypothetical protein